MAKVLVSMPDALVAEIDAAAAARGTTRSGFLQAAARDALALPDAVRIMAAVDRARSSIIGLPAFESADAVRAARDARDATDRRR